MNLEKIDIKRGDIVWLKEKVPYFTMGENVQYTDRPYVVISNNKNNDKAPTVNLACISKQVKKANYPMHVFLDKNKYNLSYDSVIFAEQLCTVNKSYIKEVVASLDSEDIKKFNRALFIQVIDEKVNKTVV